MVLNHQTSVNFSLPLNFLEVSKAAIYFLVCQLLKYSFLSNVATRVFLNYSCRTSQLCFANLRANIEEMPESVRRLYFSCCPQYQCSPFSNSNSISVTTPQTLNQYRRADRSFFKHFYTYKSFELPPIQSRVIQLILLVLTNQEALLLRVLLIERFLLLEFL